MANTEDETLKHLNSSGFLFQEAVEYTVRKNTSNREWEILREIPWLNKQNNNSGFVDLVFSYGLVRITVECKRPRGGTWIFPVKPGDSPNVRDVRCLWTHHQTGLNDIYNYNDLLLDPASYVSDICVIKGQDEKSPLLERLSSQLLESQFCFAQEEISLLKSIKRGLGNVYLPVIITSAELKVCKIDPSLIDISDGTIKSTEFETVDFIRFRKSLANDLTPYATPNSIKESSVDKQRTILIMNSSGLSKHLSKWKLSNAPGDGFPWESYR